MTEAIYLEVSEKTEAAKNAGRRVSLYPECHVFPFADGFQYRQITGIKKVESAIGSFLFPPGMTDFIQFLSAAAVIIKG